MNDASSNNERDELNALTEKAPTGNGIARRDGDGGQ
jgi:hypothetical protein